MSRRARWSTHRRRARAPRLAGRPRPHGSARRLVGTAADAVVRHRSGVRHVGDAPALVRPAARSRRRLPRRGDRFSDEQRRHRRMRSTTRRATATCTAPDGRASTAHRDQPRRADDGDERTLDSRIQFWTTRGFAVVDVNYGGSSGYGRAYRERLRGQWGIADVADMVNAARHLVTRGEGRPASADRSRRQRRRLHDAGGADVPSRVFSAGASYYGVSDIEVLARDTHKFESRYLDRSSVRIRRRAMSTARGRRSTSSTGFACPLILFQGLEDKVVPPDQSERMAEAARAKGLPVAYLTFEGEQHGFRQGRNDRPQSRGRAVLLRSRVRVRARGRHRAGEDRQPADAGLKARAAARVLFGCRPDSGKRSVVVAEAQIGESQREPEVEIQALRVRRAAVVGDVRESEDRHVVGRHCAVEADERRQPDTPGKAAASPARAARGRGSRSSPKRTPNWMHLRPSSAPCLKKNGARSSS